MSSTKKEVFKDDVVSISIEYDKDVNLPFIHCKVFNWSKENYVHILRVLDRLTDDLRNLGFDFILSRVPKNDSKAQKFQNMFGLTKFAEDESTFLYKLEFSN